MIHSRRLDRPANRHDGFTLIELLVVIAIISVLLSVLLPSLNKAKEMAKTVVCLSRVKQTFLPMQMYENDYGHIAKVYDYATETSGLYRRWGKLLRDDGYLNKGDATQYRCPFWRPDTPETDYTAVYGMMSTSESRDVEWGGEFGLYSLLSFDRVTRPSSTIFLGDSVDSNTGNQLATMTREWCPIHMRHDEKANLGFVDGHASTCDEDDVIENIRTEYAATQPDEQIQVFLNYSTGNAVEDFNTPFGPYYPRVYYDYP